MIGYITYKAQRGVTDISRRPPLYVQKGGTDMKFTKMHGLGNDYIYLNCLEERPENLPQLARQLSMRRYHIGGDGIICICPSQVGDFSMEMYNADGSRGEMCGNGIRCVGKYVYDHHLTDQTTLQIETLSGVRPLWLHLGSDGLVEEVTVHMGAVAVGDLVTLAVDEGQVEGMPVSVGNPHFVLPCEDVTTAPVEVLGRKLECHPHFPNRTNVEFFRVISFARLEMRVWERGSGETHACGTGATAVFAAARHLGLCGRRAEVRLLGGTLTLSEDDDGILLRGGATTVYEGIF